MKSVENVAARPTAWQKGAPARARRAKKLRGEMDAVIARIAAGEDLCAEFHTLYQTARNYIAQRDGLGSYYKRFMIAALESGVVVVPEIPGLPIAPRF